MSEVVVHKANREHIRAIHSLVMELAIYEKSEEEFVLSVEDYYRLFDEQVFDGIVAMLDDKVVGMCIFYMTFSTWKGKMLYLEDFVVSEKYRGMGIGQLLFDEYLNVAKRRGCILTKWQVLDWNTPAINFYKRNNAIIEKEWWNGKLYINQKKEQ